MDNKNGVNIFNLEAVMFEFKEIDIGLLKEDIIKAIVVNLSVGYNASTPDGNGPMMHPGEYLKKMIPNSFYVPLDNGIYIGSRDSTTKNHLFDRIMSKG
jgi:hypothetical protein